MIIRFVWKEKHKLELLYLPEFVDKRIKKKPLEF